MDCLQAQANLDKELPNASLLQLEVQVETTFIIFGNISLYSAPAQIISQVAFLAVLHDQVEVAALHKRIDVLCDVTVLYFLHKLALALRLPQVIPVRERYLLHHVCVIVGL